jgi:DNA helicase-2/ATP-dependent DNA helicase PcrA
VTAPRGPALVLAGAGSGKTRTLTYRVAYLLEQGVKPWEILLLTFTNKAAKEMLTRVEDLTGQPRSQFWGGTFHSIGQRILRTHAPLLGIDRNFTILDAQDAESLFNNIVKETDPTFIKDKENPKARVIADAFSYARNTRRPPIDVFKERLHWVKGGVEKLVKFAELYTEAKRKAAVCDYDDLLELWLELLEKNPEVAEGYSRKFKHILVDEFQDTNRLQSSIVEAIAKEHQVMAVGDDAQCIYTWRGADYENVMGFDDRHPGSSLHKIEINYRSTKPILDFANAVLDTRPSGLGFSKELRPVKKGHQKPYLVPCLDANEQAQFVVRRICALVSEEGRRPGDITVLYRAHFQAMELQMELTRAGVPFVITSGVRFFEQAHIRDFVAQLRFLHNPADTVAFTRVLALLPKVGPKKAETTLDAGRKEAASRNIPLLTALNADKIVAKLPEEARDDYRDLILTLQDMDEAMHGADPKNLRAAAIQSARPPSPAVAQNTSSFFDDEDDLFSIAVTREEKPDTRAADAYVDPTGTLDKIPAGTRVIKDPSEILRIGIEGWYGDFLRTIYPNWEDRRQDLNSLLGFARKYKDMNELLAQLVLLNSEAGDKAATPDEDNIRLTTIHQSKGLEFPVVFVLSCADELFPLKRAIEEGDVEEERRLFYVACTRAMEELYLSYPKLTATGGPPRLLEVSRFVADLRPGVYETLHVGRSR